MSKQIIVIGAGPGGLASAMLLASKGYDVKVYEKQSYIGGRNSELCLGEFKFDMGPTFLSMPHIIEEIFAASKRNMYDYLNLIELKSMYELIFEDKKLVMTRNQEQMREQIESVYPGNGSGYDRFMKETARKLNALTPILQSKMDRFIHLFQPKVIKAVKDLEINNSLHDVLSRYFNEEELKLAFTFQSKYLGMSPWECPGAFAILSYMEHAYGIFHPIGGLNELSKAMAKVIEEYGGEIHTGNGVKKLWIEGKTVKGVDLESGERIKADDVIINGDFSYVMTNLVEEHQLKKYSTRKLEKKKYSCSTFILYLGLNKCFDLPHHTIIFSKDYKRNVEEITNLRILSENPSIYIQNASVTDPTLAPKGKSSLYVLAPVPNNFSEIDWEREKKSFRKLILKTIEQKTGLVNIEEHIEVEKMITPSNWEKDIFVYKGATFNLGHQLSQMMMFRPHNQFEELHSCWLVGGGTHPGSGLPTILESARITVNGILSKDRKEAVPVAPLPAMGGL
ncbi:phytoene desaturase family protein [Metabacillus fastidiosus]|uniref:phytoene desaturase family protein n=1 Tax=Metabacillus fastidiosus TaxID=1458 RepID=UPI002E1E2018|nr:phytoene desaturase family protein [Metabacillus fastidiosus]MED4533166.1 phytoene desaturase family protein [Metabacillus fastidiosus]